MYEEQTTFEQTTTTSDALAAVGSGSNESGFDIVSNVPASSPARSGLSNVVISDSVTVYSGVVDAEAVELLSSFLEGCRHDYYAGVLDEDSLFLIVAEGGIDSDTLEMSDCKCYQLDRIAPVDNTSTQYSGWAVARSEQQSVQISNSLGFLTFSSLEGYPHLIEGSESYAFAEIGLLCVMFAVYFVNLIFSHVGHRGSR